MGKKVTVYKAVGVEEDGRRVSAFVGGVGWWRNWQRTYRTRSGRRPVVPDCFAYSTLRHALEAGHDEEVWEAECDTAKRCRVMADFSDDCFRKFAERGPEALTEDEKFTADSGSLRCTGLRLVKKVWPE